MNRTCRLIATSALLTALAFMLIAGMPLNLSDKLPKERRDHTAHRRREPQRHRDRYQRQDKRIRWKSLERGDD